MLKVHLIRLLQNYKRNRAPRRAWVLPRPQHWFQELLNNRILDHCWKLNFRVSRDTFEYICQLVAPAIARQNTRLRVPIPVEKRVAVGLWRLATGDCYRSCSLIVGLSKASAVYCTHEFVEELCRMRCDFIKFPTTTAEIRRKIEGFKDKSDIPNVVGAVDGTHVPIKAPDINHEDYFNRKHFYSYVVQGVVDSSNLYMSVSTGYPGSMHDARVLRLSELYDAAENENVLMEPTVDINGTTVRPLIVGDSAYPLTTWLLRPMKDNGALDQHQRHFNKELSKARVVSEHAFGLTKNRWRILQKRLDDQSDRVPDTIFACCVLHNICILRGDQYDDDDDHFDDDHDDNDGNDAPPSRDAAEVLQAVVDYLADQ